MTSFLYKSLNIKREACIIDGVLTIYYFLSLFSISVKQVDLIKVSRFICTCLSKILKFTQWWGSQVIFLRYKNFSMSVWNGRSTEFLNQQINFILSKSPLKIQLNRLNFESRYRITQSKALSTLCSDDQWTSI